MYYAWKSLKGPLSDLKNFLMLCIFSLRVFPELFGQVLPMNLKSQQTVKSALLQVPVPLRNPPFPHVPEDALKTGLVVGLSVTPGYSRAEYQGLERRVLAFCVWSHHRSYVTTVWFQSHPAIHFNGLTLWPFSIEFECNNHVKSWLILFSLNMNRVLDLKCSPTSSVFCCAAASEIT